MGPHMPSISEQRHGAKKIPCPDLNHHHRHRDENDNPGPLLTLSVFNPEAVRMLPIAKSKAMHFYLYSYLKLPAAISAHAGQSSGNFQSVFTVCSNYPTNTGANKSLPEVPGNVAACLAQSFRIRPILSGSLRLARSFPYSFSQAFSARQPYLLLFLTFPALQVLERGKKFCSADKAA